MVLRPQKICRRPRPPIVFGVWRLDSKHARVSILTSRRDDVVASDIPRRPCKVPDQAPVSGNIDGKIEFFLCLLNAHRCRHYIARPIYLDRVHSRNHETQGIGSYARPQSGVAWLGIWIEAYPEGQLFTATWLWSDREFVYGDILGKTLGLVVLEDGESAIGGEEREVGMSGLFIVLHGEGSVRRLVGAGVECRLATSGSSGAESTTGCSGGVFSPEAEPSLDAEGGD